MTVIEHHQDEMKPRKLRAVTKQEVVSESTTLIAAIERAARDPNVDLDKFERLMAMSERISATSAKSAYAAALSEMQTELPSIVERGKIQIGSGKAQMYALWEDINDTIKPVLSRYGFALSFRTGQQDGKIIVTGILSHRGGHCEETTMHLPVDTSGSKNAVQAVGSSTSYGKRYTASALLNLTSRGEDDDGRAAGAGQIINDDQLARLTALAAEVQADIPKFCAYLKVASLDALPAAQFARAVQALESKRSPL